MEIFFNIYQDNFFLLSMILQLILLSFFSFINWNKVYSFFGAKNYEGIQRLHSTKTEISRFGGFSIYLSLLFYFIFSKSLGDEVDSLLGYIIFCSIPIIIISLLEDIYHNISPSIRLFSILLSSFLFLFFQKNGLPFIEIPYLEFINNYKFLSLSLFALFLSGLANGMNLIDGTNGLASTTTIAGYASLSFLSYFTNDFNFLYIFIVLFFYNFLFLIFNYPWGKIFLGDLGAYFNGWTLGALTITFFASHPEIPTWNAVLLLFYPSFEIIFSFSRKLLQGKSPFLPDGSHLHLKVYFLFSRSILSRKVSNCLVMPFLTVFWMAPCMLIPWVFTHLYLIMLSIITLIGCYLAIYHFIPEK